MKAGKDISAIYEKLFYAFGPQHWWPADTTFEVIVGAILTQNVAWTNVEKAINNLKEKGFLSLENLLAIDIEILSELIRPAGYYNQKARYLKNTCEYIHNNYKSIDSFLNQNIPRLRKELLGIKGIGPETADSIILYAARKPIFVVDAYTKRIFARLGLIDSSMNYNKVQNFFEKNLPKDVKLFAEYHALIVKLGKDFCKNKNPLCGKCPLGDICKYA